MMFGLLSYKSKQFLWLVLKLLIVILCGYFIYDILSNHSNLKFSNFQSILASFDVLSLKNSTFLLVFTFFNWFFEIKKWQILVKKTQKISFSEATEQSLSSLTFSLITPNRIGEYGAKALYYSKEKRKKILTLNFAGNFYQLLATIVFGVLGLCYLLLSFSFYYLTLQKLLIILGILSVFLVILWLVLKQLQIGQRLQKFVSSLNNPTAFIFAFIRYLIFSHQFYVLLIIFNNSITYIDAMASISAMYLLSSLVPMLSFFDFAVKGSVAILIFSLFEIDPVIIFSITTFMWVLNFAIPAIFGSYFVLTFKPQRG